MAREHTFEDSIREVAAVGEAMRLEAEQEAHEELVREAARIASRNTLDTPFLVGNRLYAVSYKEITDIYQPDDV